MPAGRLRPAGAEEAAAGTAHARARPRRRRDGRGVAVRREPALRLHRHVHVRGRHAARGTARAGAVARPRPPARAARPGGAARPARPRRARGGRGVAAAASRATPTSCTTCCGCAATCAPGEFDEAHAAVLEARAPRVSRADRRRGTADRRRGRRPLPRRARRDAAGRPARRLSSSRRRAAALARARASRADAARSRRARRTSTSADDVEPRSHALERDEQLVRGELRPGGIEREWCDPDVLRRLRRASLAALRREVEPAEQAALGRFLPAWHGIDRRASLREALVPLQGLSCPSRSGSPRCCRDASPATSRRSSTSSARPAKSSGSAPASTASRVFFREDAAALGRSGRDARREDEAHEAIRAALGRERAVLVRPARGDRARAEVALPRCGSSSGRAR